MRMFNAALQHVLLALVLLHASGPALAQETVAYTYDALGRLVTVVRSGTQPGNVNTAYAYDKAGNRANVLTDGSLNSGGGGGGPIGGPGSGGQGGGATNFVIIPAIGGTPIIFSN